MGEPSSNPSKLNLNPKIIDPKKYQPSFNQVMQAIQHGDSFLCNLTVEVPVQLDIPLEELYDIAKAKHKLWIFTYPMKGTINAEIPHAKNQLLQNQKEKAEHYTIVDLMRNDLSQVAHQHMYWHNRRFNGTRKYFFDVSETLDLEKFIQIPPGLPTQGVMKCKLIYDQEIREITYEPYVIRPISSFQLVEVYQTDYAYKRLDRSALEVLKEGVFADEIIIVKHGNLTDASYANLIFFDGKDWFTPDHYLLNGTMRQHLLNERMIHEKAITPKDLTKYTHFKLINAMMPMDIAPAFSLLVQTIQFKDANFKAMLLKSSPDHFIAKDINGNYFAIDANGDGEIQIIEAEQYFNQNGFVYVNTPIITGSDAEGAGEMFTVTTLPFQNTPTNETGNIDYTEDFFGKKTHLTVSGQLEAEAAAMGLGKVYTFGPTFRAENSNTSRHMAEFWMIEPEMAFYNLDQNMDLAEDFLKYQIQLMKLVQLPTLAFEDRVLQELEENPALEDANTQEDEYDEFDSNKDENLDYENDYDEQSIDTSENKTQTPAIEMAIDILNDSFERFTKKHYKKIIQKHDITEEELKDAIHEIERLNPKPGKSFGGNNRIVEHIIPDFTIRIHQGQLELTLNGRNAPELRISRQYSEMLDTYKNTEKKSKEQEKAVLFVKQKLDAAKWFVDAVKQRQNTLYKTMSAIMEMQKEYFLTESLTNEEGEEISTREIKRILQNIIDKEDKRKPLTDEKLAKALKDEGYSIARRTVAKYREQLNIPVGRLRKEI
ncbi:unnamed protein product [Cyprideis torosa]|uniref:Uncharacterized protein n=1 Tax=Cyprideis torosa TaxID=163714 RepID=A0A7R8ZRW2_9CRUS|nr:unnamed protein product [Cyprideis torosa]CAG0894140.1 unnamed protein product [Cyprideis torosa]